MINFIYLAHTQSRYRLQAWYSILTLLEFLPQADFEWQIVVYSDSAEEFQRLGVKVELINQQTLQDWRGPMDFVHRGKVKVMQDAAKKFDGHLFFVDSDNCVIKSPNQFLQNLDQGIVIMDKLEYLLGNPADRVGEKYWKFLQKQPQLKTSTGSFNIDGKTAIYNSGIIGIPEQYCPLLPDILALCDDLHQRFPKHLSEQYAFGITLGRHATILPFEEYSYHWFGHGQAINEIIAELHRQCSGMERDQQIKIIAENKQRVLDAPLNPDKKPKWYKKLFR